MLQIHVKEHPLLDAAGVVIELPGPQGEESPPWLQEMISPDFPCEPMTEELRSRHWLGMEAVEELNDTLTAFSQWLTAHQHWSSW